MSKNSALDTRMKTFYEAVPKTRLMRRTPVAIRIDGKAFHTYTRHLRKPFDEILVASMQATMKYLCENIQGCVFGYTQSDEITLILIDYQTLTTSAWFDYEVQKMCSVVASMATMAFNKNFTNYAETMILEGLFSFDYIQALKQAEGNAMFDARVFNIPKEEVVNLVYYRQLDASKNSVQMVARTYFSDAQLKNKNTDEMQDMLFTQYGVNWNDLPTDVKRGSACVRVNGKWKIDHDIPIFKGDNREYIGKLIEV